MKNIKTDNVLYTSSEYEMHGTFWKDTFRQIKRPFNLAKNKLKFKEPGLGKTEGAISRTFEKSNFEKVKRVAGDDQMAWYVVMLTALQFQLSKYTSENTSIVKTPVYNTGNDKEANHELIIALETPIAGTLRDLIVSVREKVTGTYKYNNYPIALADESGIYGDGISNIACYFPSIHKSVSSKSIFDIQFRIDVDEAKACMTALYDKSIHDEWIISAILEKCEAVISFIDRTDTPLSELPDLTHHERQLLSLDSIVSIPEGTTVISLFEEQVRKHHSRTAVVFNDAEFTYDQIDMSARRLAHYLINEYQVRPGDRVGLMLKKSERLIIALLAVLKAGAVYVPIDDTQPVERRDMILSDAAAKVLLIDSENMLNIGSFQNSVFVMDLQINHLQDGIEKSVIVSSGQDVYIIYTSGSTGKPKGVLVPHRGVTNTIMWRREYYGFNESDVALQLFSPFFDGSVTDIFTTLVSGGTLVLSPEDRKSDVMWLSQLIAKYRVTNFIAVPSLYKVLLNELSGSNAHSLRSITLAGEDVDRSLVLRHYNRLAWVKLFNEYGPTENSVCSTAGFLAPDEEVTMGRAITNVHTYVLNQQLTPVPPGGVGELYLGGSGLANGYLNHPEITTGKFISNSFNTEGLLYRTGDYVRYLSFGKLKFLGRADNQTKYRGYRIELEEIEQTLKMNPSVKDAVVDILVNGLSEDVLTGFIIVDREMTEDEMRTYLHTKLPAYMSPDKFIFLQEFPVGPTGKTDRKKLKTFDLTMQTSHTPYVEPATEIEAALARIWQDVLGHEKVGTADNFFFLGGHSLKATQITSRILKVLKAEIDIHTVFNNPTIESLARAIEGTAKIVDQRTEPVNY